MGYIRRAVEETVLRKDGEYKCVLVTGARQTGKTTMVRRMFPDMKYVSLDDPFLADQARDDPYSFMASNRPPVIFDEVQRATSLFHHIKMRCDESDGRGLFLMTGSQPFQLMQNVTESLSGRVGIITLDTLSLREIMGDAFCEPFVPTEEYALSRAESARAPDDIWKIIHRGGYPVLWDGDMEWADFYSDYVNTYLERDVRSISAVQNLGTFRKFMAAVAARTGQVLNYTAVANEIEKDVNTVKNWMSVLEASGIIYLLEPYASSALKRSIRTPKVYFRDTGLAAYLTRWMTRETLAEGAASGAFFETFAVDEILKSYSNRGLDYRNYVSYYRGKDKVRTRGGDEPSVSEIDLIIEQDGVLYPVEIKKGVNVTADETRAFTVLDRIEGKTRGTGAVICMCPQPGGLRENVLRLPVWYI